MMNTVLGIDLGTQSLKALIYDYEGKKVVACEQQSIALTSDSKGTKEQETQWWIEALTDCLNLIPLELKQSIQAISVSGQQHGFVALDAQDRCIRPVKLWCDTSSILESETLNKALGGESEWIKKVGNPVLPGYTISKILWLKNHEPEKYARLAHILLPHDYLNFYLCGTKTMEFGDASGTGLLDIETRTWSKPALKALDKTKDISQFLPKLHNANEFIGKIKDSVAKDLGIPKNIPIATGGGDNMMAAIGTGNVDEGKMTMSLGTSATLYTCSNKPIIDKEGGDIAAFCSSTNQWLPLICSLNCANAKSLIENIIFRENNDPKEFEEALANSKPGSEGVLTLPFFNGERSPYLPTAKGSILGLDEENFTPNNLLRSAIEGAMYTLKLGEEKFSNQGINVEQIRLTGGGANSPHWRQCIADIFNKDVWIFTNNQGAAFGAALQALWVLKNEKLNKKSTIQEICMQHVDKDIHLSNTPNKENVSIYQMQFEKFKKGISFIKDFY